MVSKPPPAPPISHAPSPHQNSWSSRLNRTPSPMSPTPSPAGSTGSLESRGSSIDLTPSKLPNGNMHMSPATITYPQRIHSITQQYITSTGYLVQSHDLWDQADVIMQEVKGFFDDLDEHSESLTLLCSIQDLVCYLQKVVEKLKDTWKFLWEAGAQYDSSGALVRSWKFRLGVQVFSVFSSARAQPRGERVAELNIWCSKVKGSKWNYTSEGSYLMTDSISQVCFQSICE